MSPLGPVKYLTIHCAATPEGRDVAAQTVAEWDIAKFGQESYHHIVTLDGWDHVRLGDDVKGAHVGNHNTGNIGVCYVGGVDAQGKPKDTRTADQKETLAMIVDHYREKYPDIQVLGHRDWPNVAKACPSFNVAAWLQTLGDIE